MAHKISGNARGSDLENDLKPREVGNMENVARIIALNSL